MAVSANNIQNTSRALTNGKSATATSTPAKETGKPGLFQSLLNGIKPKTATPQAGASWRNRPATSEIINSVPQKTSKIARTGSQRSEQNVNNLAASTLIALTATSSGRNRVSGRYPGAIGQGTLSAGGPSVGAFGLPSENLMRVSLKQGQEIGALSAQFESGEKGPDVIGFDDNGGTSYGTYQISSRAGTMRRFIEYLSDQAPDLARRLKAAGPANTGGRSGRMPQVWKSIADEDPEKFSKLQYDFIEKTHYIPALEEISERTGMDISSSPRALQEVLWSTAVQHGPNGAAKIFSRAMQRAQTKDGGIQLSKLIGSVYDMRAGQFGSSDSATRAAVRNRFREEGRIALAMLSDPFLKSDGLRA